MANITASLVNELRQRTGVGMMDCKKALVECDGDMDKAIDYLRGATYFVDMPDDYLHLLNCICLFDVHK